MRESELIHKIIREWEAMSLEEKETLQISYIETSGDKFLKESVSKSKSKSKSGSPKSLLKGKNKPIQKEKKKKSSPKVRVFTEKKAKDQDSQDPDIRKEEKAERVGSSASESSS